MADEKGVALAVLGVVAVLAIVGLVLLFTSAKTGSSIYYPYNSMGGQFIEMNKAGLTDYMPDEQYMPEAMTGGPFYVRNRWAMGDEPGGPRWRTEAGAEVYGTYGDALNTGPQ